MTKNITLFQLRSFSFRLYAYRTYRHKMAERRKRAEDTSLKGPAAIHPRHLLLAAHLLSLLLCLVSTRCALALEEEQDVVCDIEGCQCDIEKTLECTDASWKTIQDHLKT